MSNGEMLGATNIPGNLTEALNREGRTRALKRAKAGGFDPGALNFLARQRFNEDRHFIEAWLRNAQFEPGAIQSSDTDTDFAFTSCSDRRAEADQILSRWDGKKLERGYPVMLGNYNFLGELNCTVEFASAPGTNDGMIHLYLIPESQSIENWASSTPEHYLIADLAYGGPTIMDSHGSRNGRLLRVVNFIISGVTPGKYRLKVVWNKVAPFPKEGAVVCRPHAGDYESESSPVVQIRAGVVTEGVRIECAKRVTN
jgi:hypothetical protein